MKRALILVVAVVMIFAGVFMGESDAKAEVSAGKHYVKGVIVALEGCYTNHEGTTCLGVVDVNGTKRGGRIYGDKAIGEVVYKQCDVGSSTVCDKAWHPSIGENYLRGGQIEL